MEIKKYGDPVLRKKSEVVENIGEKEIEILNEMVETMHKAEGVGLAAPQVGINLRMFVLDIGDGKVRKVINPEFTELSKEIVENEEGCLSIPGIYKKVKRPEKVTIKYQNEKGEEIIESADGLLARAFQHENDHLDGELFVDKISPVAKRLVSNKLAKLKKDTQRLIKNN